MTRSQLITKVANDTGISAVEVEKIMDGIFGTIGDVLKMNLGLYWTANRFALFNFSTSAEGEGGFADFNWFRFHGK